ncbi:competence protein ComEC family protein [Marinomonas sp. C2222]|uniref:Competence protein ComEC family protein n=1 Tax=Marinomonas sargassi TaxID=2984494 RepID=A0ABT2YS69_9GAMM|nr:ComEC/Rec2 family competence protein [Marinomonas sargassi]MCV2402733.1 competence protein ComEC family protein [Marinomonas sargassi]
MLLTSLSILIGAVLVPLDYVGLYSTHIVLVCLYLIVVKRWIVLSFIFISIISAVNSEFFVTKTLPIEEGQRILVNFDSREMYLTRDEPYQTRFFLRKDKVIIRLPSNAYLEQGVEFSLRYLGLEQAINTSRNNEVYWVKKVTLSDKSGGWKQRQLYQKRLSAEIELEPLIKPFLVQLNDESIRHSWLGVLDEKFAHASSWRFSKALLFGDASLWGEKDTWVIRTLGLAHLFVVSGLHTGFMFVLGMQICRVIWWLMPHRILLRGFTRWQLEAIAIPPLLLFYGYLTSWGEPVVRAMIMLSLYLGARILLIRVSALQVVTFTLWLVLLIEPRAILNAGLWLSFSMVYLLISFFTVKHKFGRIVFIQLMLSTASMVLILGWQEAISSVSILMNLVLIPFAAFIWFPWGWLSCLETLLLSTDHAYRVLDSLLSYVLSWMEWGAFNTPLLDFELNSPSIHRWLLLFLVVYWVFHSPLKRGWLAFIFIVIVLFFPASNYFQQADFVVENSYGSLLLSNREKLLLSNDWYIGSLGELNVTRSFPSYSEMNLFLSPSRVVELSSETLINSNVDWIVLEQVGPISLVTKLDALQVGWLEVLPNESLHIYFVGEQIRLKHSACIYSIFLLRSDTCKRVEKLESVVNYRQN